MTPYLNLHMTITFPYSTLVASTVEAHKNNPGQTWAWASQDIRREEAVLLAGNSSVIEGCKRLWVNNSSAAIAAFTIFPTLKCKSSIVTGIKNFQLSLQEPHTVFLCHFTERNSSALTYHFSFVIERTAASKASIYCGINDNFLIKEMDKDELCHAFTHITTTQYLSLERSHYLNEIFCKGGIFPFKPTKNLDIDFVKVSYKGVSHPQNYITLSPRFCHDYTRRHVIFVSWIITVIIFVVHRNWDLFFGNSNKKP